MSHVTIQVFTDNAAFEDGDELPRILNELALRIQDGALLERDTVKLFDINGNRVGEARGDGMNHWDEHSDSKLSHAAWRAEVANGNTLLGYHDWTEYTEENGE